jgi:hypothetical protein
MISHLFKSVNSIIIMKKRGKLQKEYERKIIGFIKFFFMIIICFLPSFIFTAIFVQYGSPFVNYFKFISNFESSWVAWLSAVAILILFSLSKRLVKTRRKFKIIENAIPSIILILCFIAIFALISVQSYLYANFLLGNDILVKLSASEDNLFFNNQSDSRVEFKISATSAPFCYAQCTYTFLDASTGEEIEKGNFNLTSSFSKTKPYEIKNNNLLFGTQILKRFEVSCKNIKGLFCRTKEQESKRAVLITVNYNYSSGYPQTSCCYMGVCEKCCSYACSSKNYPVIFLHGHSINKELPADYSLDVFTEIKDNLSKEGYLDAGAVIIDSRKEVAGLWGKVNAPVIVTASYFFDTYKNDKGETIVSSTSESIDTYAERLNRIVQIVKTRTGKDKVILVSHSMGGLVIRDYLALFGDNDVDKAILVTAPNHGVDDKVKDYCSVFGSAKTCSDMDKNGDFIKRLNENNPPSIPVYNIIGIGCDMGDDTGDGIIKNSSQYLSYANNYYVSGTCDEMNFNYLHEEVIYPAKSPEACNIIKSILDNQKL